MKINQKPIKPMAVLYGILFVLLGWVGIDVPSALADDGNIAVITSVLTPKKVLTREEVVDIFFGRAPPSERWRPIDSSNEPLRQQFYQSSAHLSSNRARAIWASLIFANRAIPPREMSPEKAVLTVANEPFGITYIFQDRVPNDVKVLLSLPSP